MGSFQFWQRWLLVVSVLLLLGGLGMFAIGLLPFVPPNDPVVAAFWPEGDMTPAAESFFHWTFGVWGSTLAGWAVALIFLARYPFKRKEKWAWNAIVVGIAVWFPTDTFVSAYFRVHFNVILNLVILVLVILPLVFTRKEFTT